MSIIELEITLRYVEPRVERTLLVPSDVSLDDLHSIIQEAVGWTDPHLYMFSAGEHVWSLPDPDCGRARALPPTKSPWEKLLRQPAVGTLNTSTISAMAGRTR